ncbi:MAG TPA: VWA domain-containing protein [Bryobacteraceae bacterium]|nr:VWA domain-containing protein [Bryobacteraceae bacterium]
MTFFLWGQIRLDPDEFVAHSQPYIPPPPPDALRSEVKLVEVPVVVRDNKRHTVAGLKQSDFQILDSGKEQTITMFSVESQNTSAAEPAGSLDGGPSPSPGTGPVPATPASHPRFIALCFDNVSSTFADLRYTKTAAEKFVKTGLAPGDRVAVFTTSATSGTVTFTDQVPDLVESIEKVVPQPRFNDNEGSQCPRITGYQAYLISNNMDPQTLDGAADEDMACKNIRRRADAIQDVQAISRMIWEHAMSVSRNTLYSIGGVVDTLSQLHGRRMLLLASSGFLSGNLEYELGEMTTKALHAEVVINTLDAKGLYTVTPGRPIDAPPVRGRAVRTQIAEASIQSRQASATDDAMAVLALGTGGQFYHNNNDFDKGFHELGSIPETVYILGFSPSSIVADGKYHPLKVKLAPGHHYSLQARMGYSAPTKAAPAEQPHATKLDTEALAADSIDEVPVTLAWQPAPPENGNPSLKVALHLDVKRLKFDTHTGRRALKLDYIISVLAPGGAFIGGRQGDIDLALKDASFDALSPAGMNVILPLQVVAGKYTLRAVVREELEGKMSAASLPIEVK